MKIYRITSPNTELVYVGKTTMTLAKRMICHKSGLKGYLNGKKRYYCSSFKVIECGDAVIELIEETDDSRREAHWIRELAACNQMKMRFDRSDKASRAECDRKYDQKYYQANRVERNRRAREQIPCDHCGRFSSRVNMQRHKRGKPCLEFIQEPVLGDGAHLPLLEQPTVE